MPNLFLKPARDGAGAPMLVRDPVTMKPLAEAGEWKAQSPFWIRRMRDADVIDATGNAGAPSPQPEPLPPAAPPAGVSLLAMIKPE